MRLIAAILTGVVLVTSAVDAKTEPKQPVKKLTAKEIGDELTKNLQQEKIPWQFYQKYADLYYAEASRIEFKKYTQISDQIKQKAWVDYYRGLGDLLLEMMSYKKTIDSIKITKSNMPTQKKLQEREVAKSKHRRLSAYFFKEVQQPPGTKVKYQVPPGRIEPVAPEDK